MIGLKETKSTRTLIELTLNLEFVLRTRRVSSTIPSWISSIKTNHYKVQNSFQIIIDERIWILYMTCRIHE